MLYSSSGLFIWVKSLLILTLFAGCASLSPNSRHFEFPSFEEKFQDVSALKDLYYEGKGCQNETYQHTEFKHFIDVLIASGDTSIWKFDDQMLIRSDLGEYREVDYVKYSESYVSNLSEIANQVDSKWLKEYVNNYRVFNDIGPAVVGLMMTVNPDKIEDPQLKNVLIVHYFTACYTADPQTIIQR